MDGSSFSEAVSDKKESRKAQSGVPPRTTKRSRTRRVKCCGRGSLSRRNGRPANSIALHDGQPCACLDFWVVCSPLKKHRLSPNSRLTTPCSMNAFTPSGNLLEAFTRMTAACALICPMLKYADMCEHTSSLGSLERSAKPFNRLSMKDWRLSLAAFAPGTSQVTSVDVGTKKRFLFGSDIA